MLEDRLQVTIYTDGAAEPNPGAGGYGVVLLFGTNRTELSAGYRMTTNNRMEMMAAIVGLKFLKRECAVTLYSDSRYLVDAMSKGWAQRWRSKGWMRNKKDKAQNPDLWEELLKPARTIWFRILANWTCIRFAPSGVFCSSSQAGGIIDLQSTYGAKHV